MDIKSLTNRLIRFSVDIDRSSEEGNVFSACSTQNTMTGNTLNQSKGQLAGLGVC